MNNYITKALEHSDLLTVPEFIKYVNYPIDTFMIDRFWASIKKNQLIYVDDDLIRWMGYNSSELYHRKMTFMKLLVDREYYEYTNKEYEQFLENPISPDGDIGVYPPVDKSGKSNKVKHVLLPSKTLKLIMMKVNTSKGDQVREYYLSLEELFSIYVEYQNEYKLLQTTAQLALKDQKLQEQDQIINRISLFNQELIDKQKFNTRDEILYIGSTYECARQGLFKASKTKDIKSRNAAHNTTHPVGDEFVILYTIKCSNALQLEQRVKHILKYWRPSNSREYYKIPYILLVDVIELLANDMTIEEEFINSKIDEYKKRKVCTDQINYLEGVPLEKFKMLPAPEPANDLPPTLEIQITFTITGWSQTQTDEFITAALVEYKSTHKKHSWKSLYEFIKNKLDPNMKRHGLAANKDKLIETCQKYGINIK